MIDALKWVLRAIVVHPTLVTVIVGSFGNIESSGAIKIVGREKTLNPSKHCMPDKYLSFKSRPLGA